MLRKSIIMMALAAAFTMNVNAVQIEVPKWQPPVPGADVSIPANAYENYSHINEKAIQEAEIFSAKVQKNVEKPKTAIEKVFKDICRHEVQEDFFSAGLLSLEKLKKSS